MSSINKLPQRIRNLVKSSRTAEKSRVKKIKARTQGRLTRGNLTSLSVEPQSLVLGSKSVPLGSNSIPVPLTSNLTSKAVTHGPIRNSQTLAQEITGADDMPEAPVHNEMSNSVVPRMLNVACEVLEAIVDSIVDLI
jgi:hypothetical protein